MAKKKEIDKDIEEIKKGIGTDKAVLGTIETIKYLKKGNVSKVFLSANVPEDVKTDLEYYSKLIKADVVELIYPNDELGVLCKKPFPISVICLLK
ncbi:50S ribosomal protein L30 [Candidatus Woesearchaeota archaeon]|jgi:ribosomal protein L30E|nr:50S ribosomal protein L30 [Candidatus Woesearchaeota archaeon]MBT5272887.1 50S ribosomal protein L30 [Candidatus Woesearchaeota archaeon]MBT6041353.1 50S ribosomal protein L30 [Candidatus Woesearchaeota archaeon]MBT6337236.1 50S ribosomal protein L30 [Candidatus Woesearchaeota archaeon]MBT7927113.1 50S ribosomal protein L30 [Candidatus Woesearchaeota archaeon]